MPTVTCFVEMAICFSTYVSVTYELDLEIEWLMLWIEKETLTIYQFWFCAFHWFTWLKITNPEIPDLEKSCNSIHFVFWWAHTQNLGWVRVGPTLVTQHI